MLALADQKQSREKELQAVLEQAQQQLAEQDLDPTRFGHHYHVIAEILVDEVKAAMQK
jgi:hypothetical protein